MSKLRSTSYSLPLELRQTIYHLAATDSTEPNEISVKFTLSKDATAGVGAFDALPALDLLRSLFRASGDMYQEALDYLTSAVFCWVLASEEQPHLYLLRALRKHVPAHVLARIRHIKVSGSPFLGHTCPAPLQIVEGCATHSVNALLRLRGDYIHHLGPNYDPKKRSPSVYSSKAKSDIAYSLTLLTLTFPGLSRIDLELDIADCIYVGYNTYATVEWNFKSPSGYWSRNNSRFMMETIAGIGAVRSTAMIDIHIFWKDFGIQGRFQEWEVDDETLLALKKSFIEHVRTKLEAKSITGHI